MGVLKRLASLPALLSRAGNARGMLRRLGDVERIRHAAPRVLFGVACLCLLWLAYSFAWPIRLPEPDVNEAMVTGPVVTVQRGMKEFAEFEPTIKSRTLFAPSTPIVAKAAGSVVVDELLKKVQLAGITNLRGQPAAIIRLNGKGGLYKPGDQVGSFTLKEVFLDKVVLMIDGQPVELTR